MFEGIMTKSYYTEVMTSDGFTRGELMMIFGIAAIICYIVGFSLTCGPTILKLRKLNKTIHERT